MIDPALIGAAALLAAAGAGHCLGMCAGISGALTFTLPGERQQGLALWGWQLLFSGGRVLSYTLLGALAGGLGAGLMTALPGYRQVPLLASALLMLLLALWLVGLGAGLGRLEQLGQGLWRRLQPLLKRLLPVDHPIKALLLGMAWGLLPCGLVYSALALAISTADTLAGALVMLTFGLVTLPTVVTAGVITGRLGWLRTRGWRYTAALLALLMAVWFGWQALEGAHAPENRGHQHHH